MKKILFCCLSILLAAAVFAQPQQHDGPPKPPSVAERWTHDSTRLQLYVVLSPTQISSIKAIFFSFYNSMDALMQANSTPPPKEEIEKIIKNKENALQQIFTPEQKIRYHTFRKELMPPPPDGFPHKLAPINS